MSVPPVIDLQVLLSEDRGLRRLARRLAADPDDAEDLVQDAWVAALSARASGSRPRSTGPWLSGVMRHLWLDWRQGREQRRAREERSARGEALPSAGELAGELELRQRVVACLLELEEPYRRALTLRFFHDRSLKAIAEAEGVSVTALHERVQRGLARLRARLDREHGGRRSSWSVALLGLARPPVSWLGSWVVASETVLMAGGMKLAASLLVIGGGLAWWWSERDGAPERAPGVALAQPTVERAREDRAPDLAEPRQLAPEERVAAELPQAPPAVPDATAVVLVRGRVIDSRGAPVASVEVDWAEGDGSGARSAADGSFELEPAPGDVHRILCTSRDLVTLVPGEERGAEGRIVVVAPRASFAGVVLDAAGEPVAHARLSFQLRERLFRELGLTRGGFRGGFTDERWATVADAEGRFALTDVSGGSHAFLQTEAQGFWPAITELPEGGDPSLVITLERYGGLTLRGVVLDALGVPVEGAQVSGGAGIVKTDEEGRFEIDAKEGLTVSPNPKDALPGIPIEDAYLVALKPGFAPARERLAELDLHSPIELRLGSAPASITGRVVDGEGRPFEDVAVWIRNPTRFGRDLKLVAESTSIAWDKTIEEELSGGRDSAAALTREGGTFEVGGLLPLEYEVMASDPDTAQRAGPWMIAGGSRDVELVLPRELRMGRVAGRVASVGGEPLESVTIFAQRRVEGDNAYAQLPQNWQRAVHTDAEGRFEFDELALEGTSLVLHDPRFFIRSVDLDAYDDLEHVEIVEALLCELQVDLTHDPELADAVRVLDDEGNELQTIESFGNGFTLGTEAWFRDGLTSVLSIRETAKTLVLRKDGAEVLRRPLRLDPHERTVVRP
jgi:RNA polymerase sigma-70 factor (ECF subfamily)